MAATRPTALPRPDRDEAEAPAATLVVDDAGQWSTLAELAERSGRDRAAVRSWVRRRQRSGQVRTRHNNRGETQVWATPELLAELGQDRDPDRDVAEARPVEEMAELRHALGRAEGELAAKDALVAELREALALERTRADRLEAQLTEERATVARAGAERDKAGTEATVLREAMARAADHATQERARADRLEAALAEARRPWLARVLEGLRRKGS